MRLAVTAEVRDHFEQELPAVDPHSTIGISAAPLHPLFLKTHPKFPDFGVIHEVPWFESVLQGNNMVGAFDVLVAAERQFAPVAMKHYRGTWDAILQVPGVRNNPTLLARARSVRHDVVNRMAYRGWQDRRQPAGDAWHDWFVAEGIIKPPKC